MSSNIMTRAMKKRQPRYASTNTTPKAGAWQQERRVRERKRREQFLLELEQLKKKAAREHQANLKKREAAKQLQEQQESMMQHQTQNDVEFAQIDQQMIDANGEDIAGPNEPEQIINPSPRSNEDAEAQGLKRFGQVSSDQALHNESLTVQMPVTPQYCDPALFIQGMQMIMQPIIAQELNKRSYGSAIEQPTTSLIAPVSNDANTIIEEEKNVQQTKGDAKPAVQANRDCKEDGDNDPSEAEVLAAAGRLRHLSKLKPEMREDKNPRTWRQLQEAKSNGDMLMRWCEISANCDRVLKTQMLLYKQKKMVEGLKKALKQMDGNEKVAGYKGLKQVGKFALYPYRQCKTCDALVLTCTRDTHKNIDCSNRPMTSTHIIGTKTRPFCALCLQSFNNVDDVRLHMSKYWSEEQLKVLGYRAIYFKDMKPKRPGQPMAAAFSSETVAALKREPEKNEEAHKEFFNRMLGTSDMMMSVLQQNCGKIAMKCNSYYGSLVNYDGYLSITTSLKCLRDDYLKNQTGDFLHKALYNYNSVARDCYLDKERPQKMLFNEQSVLWQTRKWLGKDDSKYCLRRYFDKFRDDAHRCDLAYAMLSLAKHANERQVYFQRLYDPDLWYWVETETDCGAYYSGQMWNFAYDRAFLIDPNVAGIRFDDIQNYDYTVPLDMRQNNYEDVLIFALNLLGGKFKEYGRVDGVYLAHAYDPMKVGKFLKQQIQMPNKPHIEQALNMIRYRSETTPDYETTLELLTKIFKVAGFHHSDPDAQSDTEQRNMLQLNQYAYLNGEKFARRKAVIKDCVRQGRQLAFQQAGFTLFPRELREIF